MSASEPLHTSPDEVTIQQYSFETMGRLLTLQEAAAITGFSREWLRLKAHSGEITYFQQKPGSGIRIPEAILNKYVETRLCPAQESPLASSGSTEKKTGTSGMDGKSIAQRLQTRSRLNAS